MKKGQINIGYSARKVGYMSGAEKLVGQAERYSTIEYAAIVAYAAKAAAVPESSIEMAMEAIFDAVNYFVLNGHSVQIPNLGTFSLGISAKSTQTEAEFTAKFAENLRRISIRFLPDPELKQMISSTTISTSVTEDAGYQSDAVLAVRSALLFSGNVPVPVVAGTALPLANMNRLVFNGTRLTKEYLGSLPLSVTYIKADNSEETVSEGGLSFSYNQLSLNLAAVRKNFGYVAIKAFVLKDKDQNVLMERQFAAVPGTPAAYCAIINEVGYGPGGTVPYKEGEPVVIKMLGFNLASVAMVKVGTEEAELISGNASQISFSCNPAASGNYPIAFYTDPEGAAVFTFNLSFGEAGGTVVTAVTANGDALINGGTTNITAGSNYSIIVSGQGLTDLEAANFELPDGTTIVIGSKSNTQIQATIQNAQAGDFKIIVDDEPIFTAALVAVQTGVTVTGYKDSANGAHRELSQAYTCEDAQNNFELYLEGQNLDDLTTASFSGAAFSGLSYAPATGVISGHLTGSGTNNLVITDNGTTIGTLKVTAFSEGGDGGDDY